MSDENDPFQFIYGDDFGAIDTEILGSMNGTTTREMTIPDRLARSLYEELDKHFEDTTEKYIVYGSDGYHIANVCIVKASGESEAIQRAKDHAGYVGSRPRAKKVDDNPEHGDVWAAVL